MRGCSPDRPDRVAPTRRSRSPPPSSATDAEPGLRQLPAVPHGAGRVAPRRDAGPHRQALHRRQGGARAGPTLGHAAGRARLADHRRRGRRPADRAGVQRPAQGDRGAHATHRLDALHADGRGRAPDDPVALPPGHARHPDRRGRRGLPGPRPTRSSPAWRRTPPAPARGTSGGPAPWPATSRPATVAARSSRYPARLTSLGACMTAATNLAEVAKEEAELDHRRARRARADRPRHGVRRGRARPPSA